MGVLLEAIQIRSQRWPQAWKCMAVAHEVDQRKGGWTRLKGTLLIPDSSRTTFTTDQNREDIAEKPTLKFRNRQIWRRRRRLSVYFYGKALVPYSKETKNEEQERETSSLILKSRREHGEILSSFLGFTNFPIGSKISQIKATKISFLFKHFAKIEVSSNMSLQMTPYLTLKCNNDNSQPGPFCRQYQVSLKRCIA